jgi:hypothetical protein
MDAMPRLLLATTLAMVAFMGCSAPSETDPRVTPAPPDTAFPKPFVQAGAWQETEFVLQPGADRWPNLDAVMAQVRAYFLAGIRTTAPDNGITIVETGRDPETQTVSLLVTAIGGANTAVAGRQMTVLLHHDERGWWMDPKGSSRVYCLKPLGGFAGAACLD